MSLASHRPFPLPPPFDTLHFSLHFRWIPPSFLEYNRTHLFPASELPIFGSPTVNRIEEPLTSVAVQESRRLRLGGAIERLAGREGGMEKHLLEINLISAQGLKPVNGRKLQTYAVAWVDPTTKLRTRVDRVGGENPTWNDKFIFRVTEAFLAADTSAVSVEIYAVGYIKDSLVGTVRFLVNNCRLRSAPDGVSGAPAFTAVQIRRPSGRFYGVLNVGAMVIESPSDFAALTGTATAAIGYRDLMGGSLRRRRRSAKRSERSSNGADSFDSSSCGCDSADYSDGTDSSTSSSSAASTVLREWNGVREDMKTDGLGLLCGLAIQRKIQLSPSVRNFQCFPGSENKNG